MAPHVGRMHLVANAARHAGVAAALGEYDNLTVEDGTFGAGWAGAVRSALPHPSPAPTPTPTP
jgi:hypothetical protein